MIGDHVSKQRSCSAKIKYEPFLDHNNSEPCCRSRCQFCPFTEELLKTRIKVKQFNIRIGILNSSTNLVVYLTECRSCSKYYVGSTFAPFKS